MPTLPVLGPTARLVVQLVLAVMLAALGTRLDAPPRPFFLGMGAYVALLALLRETPLGVRLTALRQVPLPSVGGRGAARRRHRAHQR